MDKKWFFISLFLNDRANISFVGFSFEKEIKNLSGMKYYHDDSDPELRIFELTPEGNQNLRVDLATNILKERNLNK